MAGVCVCVGADILSHELFGKSDCGEKTAREEDGPVVACSSSRSTRVAVNRVARRCPDRSRSNQRWPSCVSTFLIPYFPVLIVQVVFFFYSIVKEKNLVVVVFLTTFSVFLVLVLEFVDSTKIGLVFSFEN